VQQEPSVIPLNVLIVSGVPEARGQGVDEGRPGICDYLSAHWQRMRISPNSGSPSRAFALFYVVPRYPSCSMRSLGDVLTPLSPCSKLKCCARAHKTALHRGGKAPHGPHGQAGIARGVSCPTLCFESIAAGSHLFPRSPAMPIPEGGHRLEAVVAEWHVSMETCIVSISWS